METVKKAAANIVVTLREAPRFKTFGKAIKAAGLENTLEGTGPFTVFVPTDEAFNTLPKGKLDTLLKPENKSELSGLLKQHILSGKTTTASAKTMEVKTLGGDMRHLRVDNRGVALDECRVTQADIACSNGVMHAIDKFLIPVAK